MKLQRNGVACFEVETNVIKIENNPEFVTSKSE